MQIDPMLIIYGSFIIIALVVLLILLLSGKTPPKGVL